MKEGVFYMLILLFIVVFSGTENSANKSTCTTNSTCQSLSIAKDINCIVPQFKFSLKRNLPIFNNFHLLNQNFIGKEYHCKTAPTFNFIKLNNLRTSKLKSIRLEPYKLRFYLSPDNQDEHHLS